MKGLHNHAPLLYKYFGMRLRSSLRLSLTPSESVFHYVFFFNSILAMTACMDKASNLMYTLVEVFTFKMFT